MYRTTLQCMAVSHWAAGEPGIAHEFAEKAKRQMAAQGGRQLSCWRYLEVGVPDFEVDTDEILRLIAGDGNVVPRFMNTHGALVLDPPPEPDTS